MTKTINTRECILSILMEVNEKKEYSHIAIQNVLSKYQYLENQERAFITRTVEGTLEYQIQLDYIINCFSKTKTGKMKPVILNILRFSVYQLKYMDRVPASAVCNEAVKLAVRKGFAGLKGFVNGVLRTIAKNMEQIEFPSRSQDVTAWLSVTYSLPKWLVTAWLLEYDADTVARMAESFLKPSDTVIRCNTARITPKQLKEELDREEVEAESLPGLPYAFVLKNYDYLQGLESFRKGLFYVQDLSSMLAVECAQPKEGNVILDVCAAPGGKSLHFAEKLAGTGSVCARDLTPYKVEMIRQNIEKSGLHNIRAEVWDATVEDKEWIEQADIVLADLPCSGLGVIGRKKDIKYNMSREQQKELAALQRKILSVVWQYVKPGGTLLYSTCTVNREENEENLFWFLSNYPFESVEISSCIPKEFYQESAQNGYIQLLPGSRNDGFFIAKLRRF